MSITNEQQNLIDNLRLPIKSFRIFALEEVIKSGDSPEILSALEDISLTETDPECSMLINHAIIAVKERISGTKSSEVVSVSDSSSFLSNWKNSDNNKRMAIISNLPARLPKDIRTIGPELLEDSSPLVTARIIRTFSRNWPEDKYNLILQHLNSDSLVLQLAALRTMVHIKPELLLSDLPELLSSSDPEIKALAIRGLVKIDKEEALNHLQALILSPNKTERLAGIQNCPFLPFDMVKPLLLKYFAAETDTELLTKAGWIIEMNPDVEVPFSLFEISERSPAKKATLVKKVLNEAVKLLEKSGILGKQFVAYTRKLQNWVNKRNALRYVRQAVAKIDVDVVPPEIDNNIKANIKQPSILEAFKEALTWPVSDKVKAHISKYLGIPEQNKSSLDKKSVKDNKPQNVQAPVSEKPKNISQLELLATITPEKAVEKFDQIMLMISHKSADTDIKIAALQCLTRCRISGAEDIATRLIKHHDVNLATAAVEYLGLVNPDCIFPYLGQCLKVSNVGMKSAALGILKNFDYNQAISYLRAMLFSTDHTQQNMAMECINQFDFALIRDMLTDFLCHDYPEPLLEAGLCHFAANPSADNVYSLYKIEQAQKGKIAEQAKALREACPEPTEEMASNLSETAVSQSVQQKENNVKKDQEEKELKAKKEAELKERLKKEKEKKASKRPAYAYRSASEPVERTSKEQLIAILESIKEILSAKKTPLVAALMVGVIIFVYLFFIRTGGTGQSTNYGGPVITTPFMIEGQVITKIDKKIKVKATNNKTYIFDPLNDNCKIPKIGSLIQAQIVEYRRISETDVLASFQSKYKVIKKYSNKTSGDKSK